MVNYLARLGFQPKKILRIEKTVFFKINRTKNCWYDFGIGKGGNIMDFALLYHNCTVGEFLKMFQNNFYFHQPAILISQKENQEDVWVKILYSKTISSLVLIRYLHKKIFLFSSRNILH